MPLPSDELVRQAGLIAQQHSLDPALICAIAEQESSWDTHAIRYEPTFHSRYVASLGLVPTEEIARSISWGLMQVMGQVAREHGFSEKFLSALCEPANGLAVGCIVLLSKLAQANEDVPRALLLWNGGANPDYANAVLARIPHYRTLSIPTAG